MQVRGLLPTAHLLYTHILHLRLAVPGLPSLQLPQQMARRGASSTAHTTIITAQQQQSCTATQRSTHHTTCLHTPANRPQPQTHNSRAQDDTPTCLRSIRAAFRNLTHHRQHYCQQQPVLPTSQLVAPALRDPAIKRAHHMPVDARSHVPLPPQHWGGGGVAACRPLLPAHQQAWQVGRPGHQQAHSTPPEQLQQHPCSMPACC